MQLTMQILALGLNLPEISKNTGNNEITGVRFFDQSVTSFSPGFLYIGKASDYFSPTTCRDSVLLVHGPDLIFVNGKTVEEISNEVFSIFDYYTNWEKALETASGGKNILQALIDLSEPIFKGPMVVSKEDGQVLAHSMIYKSDTPWWKEIVEKGVVPLTITSGTVTTADGEVLPDWTNEPKLYRHDTGTNLIGFFIRLPDRLPLTVCIREGAVQLTRAHCQLAAYLRRFIQKTLTERYSNSQSNFEISMTDILNGEKRIEEELPDLNIQRPWQLLILRNTAAPDSQPRQKKLLNFARTIKIITSSFLYQNDLLVIISMEKVEPFINEMLKLIEKQYYTIGVSLPFSSLKNMRDLYLQSISAINEVGGQINRVTELGFSILLKQAMKPNCDTAFLHPVLETLASWDRQYSAQLYETLYYYLQNERNIKTTSERLGIHRNTLSYRIEQIKNITYIDLDNPKERNCILLSFWLNKKNIN